MIKSYKIVITGRVQGVGFRPFVYIAAKKQRVKGTVSNNEEGVIIYASGSEEDVLSFYNSLVEDPPKVARIQHHELREIELQSFKDFQIIPSQKSGKLNLQLTPDFAICEQCSKEMADTENRRYNYPFTTCVYCGPRWAITNTFPFERDHTNINSFKMCSQCETEYTDPEDRRFHSQTNSCPACGIQFALTDKHGIPLKISEAEIFRMLGRSIREGQIVAIKNTAGYLLCCDANNKEAVRTLRARKNRPNKPFAILYPSLPLLKRHLDITEEQEVALQSVESPIVIIPKNNFKGALAHDELAPRLNQLGIMLPYSGILRLLASELNMPIVATSGNLHGSPILSEIQEANTVLSTIADLLVHHNLKVSNPQDDSVVKYSAKSKQQVIFRRSRGLAPNFAGILFKSDEKVLAMGGHLKSTIAYVPNDFLYVSQYLGNLDHYEVYQRLTQTVEKFTTIFEQPPEVVLADKHPGYLSTQFGMEFSKKRQAQFHTIQHHKAHFASVLGEHQLFTTKKPIMGVIWDGTGYGDDEQIWGGEFFRYHSNTMDRVAHFDYFDWLAGDKMAKEPRLSLFSLSDDRSQPYLNEKFSEEELAVYQSLKKRNTLKTSSVGRLFDAVASLLNICDHNTYEGEAAILLENRIVDYEIDQCTSYCNELLENGNVPVISLFANLYKDVISGRDNETIIANFLYTMATLVFKLAERENITHISFSGGVFQNTVLIDMLKELSGNSYTLYFNRNLSPNDENISFGQLMYYLHINH